jgi:uncharacterized protein (TIGR02246 family)
MLVRTLMAASLALASLTATGPTLTQGGDDTQAQLQALAQRLQRVEDELAIHRMIVEYAVRLDARDLEGYLDLFAENGTWQVGTTVREGRAAIREMLAGLYGNPEIEPYGYANFRTVANVQIDVDGDRATARSRHVTLERGPRGNPTPILTGLYEDEFIREDGQWKILRRVDHPIMPTAAEWREQMAERRAAAQD